MKSENSLARRLFGDNTDIFRSVFNDFGFNSFFTDLFRETPEYDLKDCGDKYTYTLDYNPKLDKVTVDVDEDRTLTVTVRQDLDKTNSICACKYYGKYSTTLPEDCDTGWEKEINSEDGKMTISFKKFKKTEKDVSKECSTTEETCPEVSYKDKYDSLYKAYEGELEALKDEIEKLKGKNDRLLEKLEMANANNEVLERKLNNIKKLF